MIGLRVLLPMVTHKSIGLGNVFNVLHAAYHYCRFMIGHSHGRIGICMEEHTCEAKVPHIKRTCGKKWELTGDKVAVPAHKDDEFVDLSDGVRVIGVWC